MQMPHSWTRRGCLVALVAAGVTSLQPTSALAQTPVDSALLSYINAIRAIDVHAHPMRVVPANGPPDTEFDALPLDGIPAFAVPHRLMPDDPIWRDAQSALFHVPPSATDSLYRVALRAAVERTRREQGERFPVWALDAAGIDIMLANRIAMGTGLVSTRFRWVPFADPLMLPLDTRREATRTPDTRALYPKEAALLTRYLRELGLSKSPATLDAYVRTVVTPTLERWRAGGAVGIKFEAAYLRPLDFSTPNAATARAVYARYGAGGTPTRGEYKALQDYLFHTIVREAGRLHMAVQIHVLETFGGYYAPSGAAPHLLEPLTNDSTLRSTRIVIVHGGWPLVGETQALMGKPNVFADISMMDVLLPPSQLAGVLRQWLNEWPEKVLFGSDAFDGGLEQGWEQVAWVGTTTARRALAMALTGMIRDGEITRSRAEALARMVMRENALAAYELSNR
jgi:predicted TIM-barrel fold metal-dependent hydrolase